MARRLRTTHSWLRGCSQRRPIFQGDALSKDASARFAHSGERPTTKNHEGFRPGTSFTSQTGDIVYRCADGAHDPFMPWRETNPLNERARFVLLFVEEEEPNLTEACRRFGIGRPTGYKWLERFNAGGFDALADRPRTPVTCPHRTASLIEDAIVLLRKKRPTWGPKKLRT